jgi:hypothetical protein
MTQAMNLANFANSLDSSGQMPPTNLSTPVPISKGGTNASTASAARTSLGLAIGTDVPSPTGTGASGNWPINITGNSAGSAGSLVTANFSIVESGGNLLVKYGATTIVTITSAGAIVAGGSVSGS